MDHNWKAVYTECKSNGTSFVRQTHLESCQIGSFLAKPSAKPLNNLTDNLLVVGGATSTTQSVDLSINECNFPYNISLLVQIVVYVTTT